MIENLLHSPYLDSFFIHNTIRTVIFVLVVLFVLFLIKRWLRQAHFQWTPEQRLRIINHVQNGFLTIIFIGFLYIWAEELRTLIFSIVGVALAIVIATKELILCISGSTLRFRSNAYELGDRIEFLSWRGEVIGINLLSTTLMEISPRNLGNQKTGRVVSFPNALLLSAPLVNESLLPGFFIEQMKIPLHRRDQWRRAKECLLAIAKEECATFLKDAQQQAGRFERKEGWESPSVQPDVSVCFSDVEHEHVYLMLRFPVPITMRGKVERVILERFLDHVAEIYTV